MVSTEQWWGRGPGIARPKQEALHELQRTGRAEGLSGWSQCQDWRLPEDACQPRDAQRAVGGGAAVAGAAGSWAEDALQFPMPVQHPGGEGRLREGGSNSRLTPSSPATRQWGCRFFPRPQ